MFAWSLEESWRQGKLLTFGTAFALLGIVVILRAGSVLGFPFWPKPKVAPGPVEQGAGADSSRNDRKAGSADEGP
jgi:hypothetical protein